MVLEFPTISVAQFRQSLQSISRSGSCIGFLGCPTTLWAAKDVNDAAPIFVGGLY